MWLWRKLDARIPGLAEIHVSRDSCQEGCIYVGAEGASSAGFGLSRQRAPETTMASYTSDLTALGGQTGLPQNPDEATLERVPNPHPDTHLRRALHSARVHLHLPRHRAARLCPSRHRLCAQRLARREQDVQALPLLVSQSRSVPRGLHGRDREAAFGISRAALPQNWRLLVPAWRHPHRRVFPDGESFPTASGCRIRALHPIAGAASRVRLSQSRTIFYVPIWNLGKF